MKKAIITSIILLLMGFPQTPVSVLGQDSGMASIRAIAWSPDSTRLVVSDLEGQIYIVDALTGEIFITLQEGNIEDVALTVAWSPDGTKIATGGRDQLVHIWKASTGEELLALEGHTDSIIHIEWSPDSQNVVSITFGGSPDNFRIWDVATGEETMRFKSTQDFYSVDWSPNGNLIATSSSYRVSLWSPDNRNTLLFFGNYKEEMPIVRWHPDNKTLATGYLMGKIRIWNSQEKVLISTIDAHTDVVSVLDWNPDGSQLMSASWDGSVRVWNLETIHYAELLPPNEHVIYTAAWSPNGEYIAYGGAYHPLSIVPAPTDFPLETPITND